MNLRDKPVDQIKDVVKFLNETAQSKAPPGETQWNEIRYDLANVAMFLEAFTIPAMEQPIVRHEYKEVVPLPSLPVARFGRDNDPVVTGTDRNGNS